MTPEQERAEARIDKAKLLEYHRERIVYWEQFRKEYKDGSYSLQEACEIRINTHQVAINLIESGQFNSLDREEQLIAENERLKRDADYWNEQHSRATGLYDSEFKRARVWMDKYDGVKAQHDFYRDKVAEQDKEIQRLHGLVKAFSDTGH